MSNITVLYRDCSCDYMAVYICENQNYTVKKKKQILLHTNYTQNYLNRKKIPLPKYNGVNYKIFLVPKIHKYKIRNICFNIHPCRKYIKNNCKFSISKLLGMVDQKVNSFNRYTEFKIRQGIISLFCTVEVTSGAVIQIWGQEIAGI